MTHPDWALKHKTKGTELRHIGGRYYLYRISSKYDKERKVTRKITHEMIGRITPNGLIPKGYKLSKKKSSSPTVKEYGATYFLQSIASDIINELALIFPDKWKELIVLSMNRLIYQAPLKNNQFLYEESFFSESFSGLRLNKNALTHFMSELGQSRDKIAQFMSKFVLGKQTIIFDSTHIFSNSKQMNRNEIGYNSKKQFDPQINLLYLFSVETRQPIYYRVFPGNIGGVKALKLSIKESGAQDCVVIGDKGFSSEENFFELEKEKLNYIFPLKRNSRFIKYDRLKSREYQSAFDGHFLYHGRPIFYYQLEEQKGRRVTVFHDPKLKLDEESNYLRRVEQKMEGYDLETYQEKQLYFGTMSMMTNIKETNAEELYIKYKHRMEIETLFDAYKNLLEADSSYMHSDNSFEAWSFINHLSIMLYYKIFILLKDNHKLNQISPNDLLMKLVRIFKIKINQEWLTSEINTQSQKLFSSLGLSVT